MEVGCSNWIYRQIYINIYRLLLIAYLAAILNLCKLGNPKSVKTGPSQILEIKNLYLDHKINLSSGLFYKLELPSVFSENRFFGVGENLANIFPLTDQTLY